MIGDEKIVYFWEYCKKCMYEKLEESKEPCWSCLTDTVNQDSHRPTHFIAKENEE